jgi:hypothetical protein
MFFPLFDFIDASKKVTAKLCLKIDWEVGASLHLFLISMFGKGYWSARKNNFRSVNNY